MLGRRRSFERSLALPDQSTVPLLEFAIAGLSSEATIEIAGTKVKLSGVVDGRATGPVIQDRTDPAFDTLAELLVWLNGQSVVPVNVTLAAGVGGGTPSTNLSPQTRVNTSASTPTALTGQP